MDNGEQKDGRFEQAVERAWVGFEGRLRTALATVGDTSFVIAAEADESAGQVTRYVQACGDGAAGVLVEVSSNYYLGEDHKWGRRDHQALRALGWTAPGRRADNRNWRCVAGADEIDFVAGMIVATLRQVFDVLSPAFLTWPEGVERSGHAGLADAGLAPGEAEEHGHGDPSGEAAAFEFGMPRSPDELLEMVALVLQQRGQADALGPDHDGDVWVEPREGQGTGPLWVRCHASAPALEFWGVVMTDISDRRQALLQVNVLNRRTPFVRFSVRGDSVFVSSDLEAEPLVAGQFHARVDYLVKVMGQAAADLEDTVNGLRDQKRIPRRPRSESA